MWLIAEGVNPKFNLIPDIRVFWNERVKRSGSNWYYAAIKGLPEPDFF